MRYLDHAATTPVLEEVLEAMLPYYRQSFGNPSSVYAAGRDAKKGIEQAREQVAEAIGAQPSEVVFTGSGTESDDMALKGVAFKMKSQGDHIITSSTEHHAVLHSAEWLERQGFRVTFLPVDRSGLVNIEALASALRPETTLVSVMLANNEVGTIQPLIHGGGQERDLRSGTHNVAGIVGLGKAAQVATAALDEEMPRLEKMRDRLQEQILASIDRSVVNGADAPRVPGTVNVCIEGVEGESLLLMLDAKEFAASSGSACTSGSLEPSHVLLAMGIAPELALGSLRVSLGPGNTDEDVDAFLDALPPIVERLRSIAPGGSA